MDKFAWIREYRTKHKCALFEAKMAWDLLPENRAAVLQAEKENRVKEYGPKLLLALKAVLAWHDTPNASNHALKSARSLVAEVENIG